MDAFAKNLLLWYKENKRDLPWRKNVSAYEVVISEFMLQQTQVSRVIIKYQEFLEKFPTIQDLAKASKAEVISLWSGLGYNRRALLLHSFAKEVCEKYEGVIPFVPEALLKLSGIGPYTACSIASFAYNKPEPAIDVNVRRIFMRYLHGIDQGLPMGKIDEKKLFSMIKEMIPQNESSDFHNALMDFGSLVCLRDKPLCSTCLLKGSCTFYPLYKEQKERVLFVMEKKNEKGAYERGKHIPNRIFRGRIVEFVRKNEEVVISFSDFGRMIKEDYTQNEEKWLVMLCEKLKKEGFLSYSLEQDKITFKLSS